MTYKNLSLTPLSNHVGAEVTGVDVARGVSAAAAQEILSACAEHGVLVFRDQFCEPDQHIALAEALGVINVNRFFKPVTGL